MIQQELKKTETSHGISLFSHTPHMLKDESSPEIYEYLQTVWINLPHRSVLPVGAIICFANSQYDKNVWVIKGHLSSFKITQHSMTSSLSDLQEAQLNSTKLHLKIT